MKSKKKIKKLEAKIASLEKIVQKGSLTLTDVNNPNVKVVVSLKDGIYSADKITITPSTSISENITTNQNS